jgi:hypothetical protein
MNNEYAISLNNAKNILLREINQDLSVNDIQNLNPNIMTFECDALYLHIQIIYGNEQSVYNFLQNYCNQHGFYTTQLFVNHSLIDVINGRSITPVECSLLWSNNPRMLRVLYEWGADVSIYENNPLFVSTYRNHLSYYVLANNNNNNAVMNHIRELRGSRIMHQFDEIYDELNYLIGEMVPPPNWVMPNRINNLNNLNNPNNPNNPNNLNNPNNDVYPYMNN